MFPTSLFEKYKNKGVLIDTNLLLLLAVGMYAPERILTFKRTRQYTLDDFSLMLRILEFFQRRVTTPNILTEVDNLARQLPMAEHAAISEKLAQLVSSSFEVFFQSSAIIQEEVYALVGLTDTVTLVATADVLVVTDDFQLSNRVSHLGHDAVNINHIRNLTN